MDETPPGGAKRFTVVTIFPELIDSVLATSVLGRARAAGRIEVTFVDATDLKAWEAAMRPNTKAVLIETPSNPVLEITDIRAVSEIAHAVGAKVIVDNVFATPIFQQPLKLGADIVVYSATKHIDGQGRCLGGAVLCTEKFLTEAGIEVSGTCPIEQLLRGAGGLACATAILAREA